MASGRTAPYGNWKSPIGAETVAAQVRFSVVWVSHYVTIVGQSFSAGVEDIFLDPITSKVYFAQKRPEESQYNRLLYMSLHWYLSIDGRSAIVDASDRKDVFSGEWDARTKVHEYGGAAAVVFGDIIYFSHFADDRVYKTVKGGTPVPITPGSYNFSIWTLTRSIELDLTSWGTM